jgi:hypothetical protein
MKNLGKRSICQSCKKPIYHNGKLWDHVGGRPRHPATPLNLDKLRAEIAELQFALHAKKYLLQLIEQEDISELV